MPLKDGVMEETKQGDQQQTYQGRLASPPLRAPLVSSIHTPDSTRSRQRGNREQDLGTWRQCPLRQSPTVRRASLLVQDYL